MAPVTIGQFLEDRCAPSLGFLKWRRMTPPFLHIYCLQRLRGLGRDNPAISTEARRNPQPFHRQWGPEPGRHVLFAAAGPRMSRGGRRRCPGHSQLRGARETPWQCLAPMGPQTGSSVPLREEPRAPAMVPWALKGKERELTGQPYGPQPPIALCRPIPELHPCSASVCGQTPEAPESRK